MKNRMLLLLVLIIGCIGLGACTMANADSTTKPESSVQADYAAFTSSTNKTVSKSIELTVGQKVVIVLWSNPTTGYSWSEHAAILNGSVLKQLNHRTISPTSAQVIGAAGTEEWTLQATATGETTVTLQYGQPWTGGEKATYTFVLTVTVK